jgi:hypothetical protein
MKVSILSESPVDEAAIRILAEAILRQPLDVVQPRIRPGGWAATINAVPLELKRLYYNTDTEGLLIVVDSDDSPPHESSHVASPILDCRVCQIESEVRQVRAALNVIPRRVELKVAIGLPVPAIEAWFQCGKDPHAAEAPILRELAEGRVLFNTRRRLKRAVYGSGPYVTGHQVDIAVREARRLAADLDTLRSRFPRGFGSFYESLATWR